VAIKFIKIIGIIFLAALLGVLIAAIAWYFQVPPEIFLFFGMGLGTAMGLTSFVFIIDVIEGDL
jgi:hypothetical protein